MTPPDPGDTALPQSTVATGVGSNAALMASVRQLQAREAHLLGLLESAPDSVLGMDVEGMVTDWNLGAERILGWTREEALGKRMSDLIIPPKYREAHEKGMRKTLETGVARVINRIIEIEAQHKSGEIFPIELSIWTIANDSGNGFGAFVRDVSSRHKAQNALRHSEERYRSVVEHLGEGMFVTQNNRIVFTNQLASEIMHIPVDGMMGSDPVDWIHPEDRPSVLALRNKLVQKQAIQPQYELRHIGRDGVVRWLSIRPSTVNWEGGPATLTFFSEITHQKLMVEALKRSEERYKAVIEHVDSGMVVLQDDHLVYANPRAAEIVRMSVDEVLSVGFLHGVHPDDHALILDRRRRRLAGENVPGRYEVRLLHKDGSICWIELGVSVVPWDGRPATITFFSDVTERKNVSQALLRTSSEREAILNNALVGIVFGVDRSPQWVNDKFAEMVGFSREELVGQDTSHIHPDRSLWERLGHEQRAALAVSGTYSDERQLKRRNGELFWVQMAGQCIRKGDLEAGVIWTFLDITERRNAEEDARAALVKQRELNDLRSRFVAMTSHEFRTPLAAILSSAELLKYYGERLPKTETLGILKTIEDGVQRMTQMLDRVLLLGKAEAHMLEFQPGNVDLTALCKALVDEARSLHASSGCEWGVEFFDVPPTGHYDPKLLRHIFSNLLSNAVKYSPQGGTVLFRVSRVDSQTIFEVVDQGIGIPTEEIPYLFQSFHRASNVGDIQGTGLGLAIVKNSVDLHGGTIEVSSVPGQGSRFTVKI